MKNKGIILSIIFAAGIVAVLLLAGSNEPVPQKAVAGVAAPLFELKDTQGRTWKLADLKGKVVLLNFWATWCDSCKEENPSIQKLVASEWENEKFVFLSTLYKDDPSGAAAYMKQNGLSFPVLIDDRNMAGKYGITGVPETFIINKKGTIAKKVIGPVDWTSPDVRDYITKLMAE